MSSSFAPWKIWLSAQHGDRRLAEQPSVLASPRTGFGGDSVFIDDTKVFQLLLGFGGALTEAVAVTLGKLPEAEREMILANYFSPESGHGYALCRVSINSCDFALGNYACADTPGDIGLEGFNIRRDEFAILPLLRRAFALSGGRLKILASPWSPPAWMKTNGAMNGGGRLRPEFRAVWAEHYVKFIQAYEAAGAPIWAITVQNEPDAAQRWDSCLYSAEQERDFVRDHLGPALERAGLGHVKIIIWDHNRDQLVHRASVAYADPEASRFIWGSGFHWYVHDKFDNVRLHHDAWPDKHLLFTEGCQECGTHLGSWAVGERYARSIIADLNNWTEGWIDWNLLLDETGGPNHVSNFCSAPLIVETARGVVHTLNSWHYIGHFSRFLLPGSRRVLCATTRDDLHATAALNPDGSLAVVVMNATETPRSVWLYAGDTAALVELPPRSIASCLRASV
ncbi:MAG: glycoside hydrolase family 30 protein [Verrucomicrobiota bacterium]